MNSADTIHICPYPGLRSFTEDESLYFKGRDLQVDQITALLEQNKFLMVTGASGEGKSSLVYAGLIPNARAGFFKARYSNWLVAAFRPERSPLTNMARAVAEQLQEQASTVETELRRGFSSLVDLYTNSSFFIDEDDANWAAQSEGVKKEQKRKASNLLIILDQFEEFFTSPENFFNEEPSKDSQTVINLVLETARIAIRRNLPVYIICTMRADYIGQCSVFRGLPEYIGFSQFFVPRLKRKDLKQVIEQPAILSGNSISQRLIERLVYDIAEGVDQLPILQHALSQIWLAAGHGSEQMDLLHYAMSGGMYPEELPDEDNRKFKNWFVTLPGYQQELYKETGLGKVIEIHASVLYENAWKTYSDANPGSTLTQREAKRVVAMVFSCLTRIDNSRAVRNRMTLEEITDIINMPGVTPQVVGAVINVFREEGNSFIHPFKTEDPHTHQLTPETVLDITHESLIRNWSKLNDWANKEFEFYSTYIDFKKQLDRWKQSGKRRGYLLPIGPLTYFENWYRKCKPNPAWIMRYSAGDNDAQLLKESTIILDDSREFLKKSSRKEIVARTFMKYGAGRIATVFAILLMLVLSGFYGYDAEQKKNSSVLDKITHESAPLLQSSEARLADKAVYLIAQERYQPGSLMPYLKGLDRRERIKQSTEVYKQMLELARQKRDSLPEAIFNQIDSDLVEQSKDSGNAQFFVVQANRFLLVVAQHNL